jgi:hypothetical protein
VLADLSFLAICIAFAFGVIALVRGLRYGDIKSILFVMPQLLLGAGFITAVIWLAIHNA